VPREAIEGGVDTLRLGEACRGVIEVDHGRNSRDSSVIIVPGQCPTYFA
jgi:hypothetical protein